MALKTVSDMKQ